MSWNEPGRPNDPWGGNNKPNEELEALMKKLQGLFGNKSRPSSGDDGGDGGDAGDGGEPTYSRPMPVKIILSLVFVGIVVWSASGFYQIQSAERGVVLRFGKFVNVTTEGLNWHLPTPIETVEVVNISRVRNEEIGFRVNGSNTNRVLSEALMLTQDENIVDVQLSVQYTIKDPRSYLFNVFNPSATLRQVTESALREVVGRSSMDDVLTDGRERVVEEVRSLVQNTLDDYQTGIEIRTVNMSDASAPQQVQAAFNDAVKAREDKERFVNEAEAYANQILPQARGEAARITEEALAYRERVIAESTGEADRFTSIVDAYKKAPEITRERLYIQAIQGVFEKSSKILLDVDSGNNLMLLPLDKLLNPDSRTTIPMKDPSSAPSNNNENTSERVINSLRGRTR